MQGEYRRLRSHVNKWCSAPLFHARCCAGSQKPVDIVPAGDKCPSGFPESDRENFRFTGLRAADFGNFAAIAHGAPGALPRSDTSVSLLDSRARGHHNGAEKRPDGAA